MSAAKRLLILAYFYPPLAGGGVHRVLSFTRHLPAHGWGCTVVCAGERDYWVRDESLLHAVPAGTEVIRVAGGSGLAHVLRGRKDATGGRRSGATFAVLRALSDWWLLPDSYAGWAPRAAAAALARVERGGIDAVLSSSPPDSVHLAGERVAAASGLPWVADFRDPWVGLSFRRPPTPWHAARQAAMADRVIARADLVLGASRTHVAELAARAGRHAAGAPRRWLHLPNGFEPWATVAAGGDTEAGETFRLVFTGTLSLMDDAGTLLEAVRQVIAGDPDARAHLRVELAGPHDDTWPRRVAALGLGDVVRMPGPLAHAESRARQLAADVLLLWKPRGEGYRTMVPGKLYEYLDSGRPIVALLPAGDEAAELVERADGTRLDPGDAAGLAREIAARYARWRRGGRTAARRPPWLTTHERARLAGELARALDALVATGARA